MNYIVHISFDTIQSVTQASRFPKAAEPTCMLLHQLSPQQLNLQWWTKFLGTLV